MKVTTGALSDFWPNCNCTTSSACVRAWISMFTASMCSADTTNTDQHLVEYRRAWQSVTDYHLGLLSQYYTHIMCVCGRMSCQRGTCVFCFAKAALMMCQPPILSYIKSNQEAVRQHFIFLQVWHRWGPTQWITNMNPDANHNVVKCTGVIFFRVALYSYRHLIIICYFSLCRDVNASLLSSCYCIHI